MKIKKVVKIGNSYGVIFDKELRQAMNLELNGLVVLKLLKQGDGILSLTLTKKGSKSPRAIDAEAYEHAEKLIKKYRGLV